MLAGVRATTYALRVTQTDQKSVLTDLASQGPVIIDGGMGTLLQDLGLDDGGSGELWNVERPDAVRQAHRDYARAGARILTTNTFGGSRPRLDTHGLGDRVHEINRAGAQLAGEVAAELGALVAGGLGPTGELLVPLGTLDTEGAQAIFEEQLVGLRDGGIDLVLIETMSDLAEAEAAVAAAHAVVPDLPVIATLSFDTNLHSMMGVSPAAAVTALAAAGVDAAGANCGAGPWRWPRSRPRWPRPVPTGCCSSPSRTPGCRTWSATTSSTTPRPTTWQRTPRTCARSAST